MAPSRTMTFEHAGWTVTSHSTGDGDETYAGEAEAPPAWLEFMSSAGERRVSPGVGPFTQAQLDGFAPNKVLELLLLAEPRPVDK